MAAGCEKQWKNWWLWTLLCSILVVLPFFSVCFSPIVDLPQLVAQSRLFFEVLEGPGDGMSIQWIAPNRLAYLFLGLSWLAAPPLVAGRLAMVFLGVLWLLAVHALAMKRRQGVDAAIFASIFFFCHVVYWGFYSFALGWAAFVLWFLVLARPPGRGSPWGEGGTVLGVALLLLASHVLWFIMGLGWLLLRSVVFRGPRRSLVARFLGIAPVVVLVACWYPSLQSSSFVGSYYGPNLFERLHPEWLVDAALGGLRGHVEGVVLGSVVLWIGAGVFQARHDLKRKIDMEMLLLAGVLLLLVLLLPYKHMNTIRLPQRWMPFAVVFLVLAFPVPALSVCLRRVLVVSVLALVSLTTMVTWRMVERDELSGLPQALDALPESPRVLGLDFVRRSEYVRPDPAFLQTFAYSQVTRGGSLNFSFADFPTSLVVYKPRRQMDWTAELEWFPGRVKPTDFRVFSHAVIGGDLRIHRAFSELPFLIPQNFRGTWRTYKVNEGYWTHPREGVD